MPGFDLPWRANQMDPVRQICEWKNYFRKSMLRKITPRARRMGGAQRYPSRRRVNMLACRMPGAALHRVRDTRANKKRDRKAPFKAGSGLLDAYVILDSLNSTCALGPLCCRRARAPGGGCTAHVCYTAASAFGLAFPHRGGRCFGRPEGKITRRSRRRAGQVGEP